jgi:hypothetical protein
MMSILFSRSTEEIRKCFKYNSVVWQMRLLCPGGCEFGDCINFHTSVFGTKSVQRKC